MRKIVLLMGCFFAGTLCVKGDAHTKQFKLKRKTVPAKNLAIEHDSAGTYMAGSELGVEGTKAALVVNNNSPALYGKVIAGNEHVSSESLAQKDKIDLTLEVVGDAYTEHIANIVVTGDERSLGALPEKAPAVNELYVEHIAHTVVVGDELGVVDQIMQKDAQVYENKTKAVRN